MLPSFEITNFRTFSHLRIERLGRVNLIIGKNNVGKTTLLEALRFYAMGSPTALRQCLADHDELGRLGGAGEVQLDLGSLFHGRPQDVGEIRLGLANAATPTLIIRLTDLERIETSDGRYHYDEFEGAGIIPEGEIIKGVLVQRNNKEVLVSPEPTERALGRGPYVGPAFVPARGVRESDLVYWWDAISLTDAEQRVIECVSLLAPVEGVAATQDLLGLGPRTFKVRLRDENVRVPLKSLGGGPFRVFQIAVAIEYAYWASQERQPSSSGQPDEETSQSAALLLIDEIENGIHHTLHARLWESVFRLAEEHALQVFATSHSLDCMKGFDEALGANPHTDGLVIRLEKVEGEAQTGAVIMDREALPIVIRDSIEVR